jgi:glycyl-tRNA synthetase beta chain
MIESKDLLVELGLEELPHETVYSAARDFKKLFTTRLKDSRINFDDVLEYSTPRRIALLIQGVQILQEDYTEEKKGPSFEKAYQKDGSPSRALEGFLKGNGVTLKDITEREIENGTYIFLVRRLQGEKTNGLLPAVLDGAIRSLRFQKSMRWEKTGFSFARPIRWIVFLFANEVIPYEIAGVKADRVTQGHRTYCSRPVSIKNPVEYEAKLLDAGVLAAREKRIQKIHVQVASLCKPERLRVPDTAASLYETNADLTELPQAVLCRFDDEFLVLPPEVLISEMVEHQHYFPLEGEKDGTLSGRFIAVSNIKNNRLTRYGYERVLRARLDDGKFFFEEDRKHNLIDLLDRLKSVTFHEKLGSMYDKVERIGHISGILGGLLSLDKEQLTNIDTICRLCKNDLTTLMVEEFPHLQGVMGYYYALSSGYSVGIAQGISDHYAPRFADDAPPETLEGAVVGIADRLETILGIFSIGLTPKGSKDPFALRRKVLAIIRIILHHKLNFSPDVLLRKSIVLFGNRDDTLREEIESFFTARIRTIFTDMGFSYDEIDASLSGSFENLYDAYRRIGALHEMRGDGDFDALLISFRRMCNIIRDQHGRPVSRELLAERAEKALYKHYLSVREEVKRSIGEKNYSAIYRTLSTFKPVVDDFFDDVLVMEDDANIRENRIGLLNEIVTLFADIIDFSKIVQPGE